MAPIVYINSLIKFTTYVFFDLISTINNTRQPKLSKRNAIPSIILFLFILLTSSVGQQRDLRAQTEEYNPESSPFYLDSNPTKRRNYVWPPLVSILLPGFDQYWEEQYTYAISYSGAALLGQAYAFHNLRAYNDHERPDEDDEDIGFSIQDNYLRKALLGNQIHLMSASLSAYTSFRSAVHSNRFHGKFSFLPAEKEESIQDLLTAPFRFEYITRPTTYIPLLAAGGLVSLGLTYIDKDEYRYAALGGDDIFFASAFSYNAGTHEEASFRGWILPAIYENTDNFVLSNSLTAGIFAAMHYPQVKVPIAQFLLGYYFGYVTKENDWTLSESIFVHTWWDVIIFMAQFNIEKKKEASGQIIHPENRAKLWLPPFEMQF